MKGICGNSYMVQYGPWPFVYIVLATVLLPADSWLKSNISRLSVGFSLLWITACPALLPKKCGFRCNYLL